MNHKVHGGSFGKELRPDDRPKKKQKKHDPCYQIPIHNKKELAQYVIKPYYLNTAEFEEPSLITQQNNSEYSFGKKK